MAHFLWSPESAWKMNREGLIALLEPTVNALGYELVDLDLRTGGSGLVRLFIDKEPTVTLTDCEQVSRQVSDLLDVEDPVAGNYTLEVSSPGVDRRLRTPEHFAAFVGSEVRVELKRPLDGRKRFRGELLSADPETIEVRVDGTDWELPLAELNTARLVPMD